MRARAFFAISCDHSSGGPRRFSRFFAASRVNVAVAACFFFLRFVAGSEMLQLLTAGLGQERE
jgi:hypothetical protein